MREPDKYLPMNREELVGRCEMLEAALGGANDGCSKQDRDGVTEAEQRFAAEARLDLLLSFATKFEQLAEKNGTPLPAGVGLLLAEHATEWIEGFDKALAA